MQQLKNKLTHCKRKFVISEFNLSSFTVCLDNVFPLRVSWTLPVTR